MLGWEGLRGYAAANRLVPTALSVSALVGGGLGLRRESKTGRTIKNRTLKTAGMRCSAAPCDCLSLLLKEPRLELKGLQPFF